MTKDPPLEFRRDGLLVSTDQRRLDLPAVLAMLRGTHWGGELALETLERAAANSLCYGLYDGPAQIGFLAHPGLQHLRRLVLLTRDSPDLYARFGFVPGSGSLGYMELLGGASAATRRTKG